MTLDLSSVPVTDPPDPNDRDGFQAAASAYFLSLIARIEFLAAATGEDWLDGMVGSEGGVQGFNANLAALAALTLAADKILGTDSSGNPAQFDVTPFSKTLLDDADAGEALTTLGVSTFAKTLLDDADASTARATLGAGPQPTTSSSVGQIININTTGVDYSLPAGGTWFYSYTGYTPAGAAYTQDTSIVAGGTVIFPGAGNTNVARGFALRTN
ncbi:hypothetical protein [Sagittula sp. S175]|uniref:hypothetical protein n=1 Tax=Sagittula sp. S175 TaxID=3415129 RepID=UPI003C7D7771